MARNSDGTTERIITIRVRSHGDPALFDWEKLIFSNPLKGEEVEVIHVEEA